VAHLGYSSIAGLKSIEIISNIMLFEGQKFCCAELQIFIFIILESGYPD
jgi:hypothetical protein